MSCISWANGCFAAVGTTCGSLVLTRFSEDLQATGGASASQLELTDSTGWSKLLMFGGGSDVDAVSAVACHVAGETRIAICMHASGKLRVWDLATRALLCHAQLPPQAPAVSVDVLNVFYFGVVPGGGPAGCDVVLHAEMTTGARLLARLRVSLITTPPCLQLEFSTYENAWNGLGLRVSPGLRDCEQQLAAAAVSVAGRCWSSWCSAGNTAGVILAHTTGFPASEMAATTSIVVPVWTERKAFAAGDATPTSDIDAFYTQRVFLRGRYSLSIIKRVLSGTDCVDEEAPFGSDSLADARVRVKEAVHDAVRVGADEGPRALRSAWLAFIERCETEV